jgi:uncharacterized membrane protein YphA (DoxX/SURF4 family)
MDRDRIGRVWPADVRAWVATALRLLLAGVWIVAGGLKVVHLDASVRAVRGYRLLPETGAQIIGAGLPLVEIALGLLLLLGIGVRVSSVLSAVLLTTFLVGVVSVWARGLRIDCGCFGSGGQLAAGVAPSYGRDVARDSALLLAALLLTTRPHTVLAMDNLRTGGPHAPTPARAHEETPNS